MRNPQHVSLEKGVKEYSVCCNMDDDVDDENESVEALKSILDKFKKAVEKFDVLLQKCSLKCKHCEFEAKDTNGLRIHI